MNVKLNLLPLKNTYKVGLVLRMCSGNLEKLSLNHPKKKEDSI